MRERKRETQREGERVCVLVNACERERACVYAKERERERE